MSGKLKTLAVTALLVAGLSACSNETETPKACIAALDLAEELVGGPVAEQTIESSGIVTLVPEAFEAGMMGDVDKAESIIADLEEISVRTEERTAEVERLTDKYAIASADCRGER